MSEEDRSGVSTPVARAPDRPSSSVLADLGPVHRPLTTLVVLTDEPGLARVADDLVRRRPGRYVVHHASTRAEVAELVRQDAVECVVIDLDRREHEHPSESATIEQVVGGLVTGTSREASGSGASDPALTVITVGSDADPDAGARAVAAGAEDHLWRARIEPESLERSVLMARARVARRAPSAQRRATDELLVERARTRAMVGHSNDVTLCFDGDGTISWVSPSSQRVLGVGPELLVGANGFELIHESDRPAVLAAFDELAWNGDERTVEFRARGADGELRWFEETVIDRRSDPQLRCVVANLRDVTDRRASEEHHRFLSRVLDTIGEAVAATDVHGRLTYLNPAAERLYGWTLHEARGLNGGELSVAEPGQDGAAMLDRQIRSGRAWAGDMLLHRRDGSTFFGHVTNTPLLDESGACVGLIGVTTDLTDRLEVVRAAEEDRRRLAEAQRTAQLGSYEVDLASGRVTWSAEMFRLMGADPALVEPGLEAYLERVHPDDRAAVRAMAVATLEGTPAEDNEHRIVAPDGTVRWVLGRNSGSLADGVVGGTILDVTERHLAEQRLEHEVLHDPLTGLPNRVEVTRRIEQLLDAQRTGGASVTVAFCDLDRFKVINDGLGHGTGDRVLLEVAGRLEAALPPGCSVARFGGDEFVIVAPGSGDPSAELERIRSVMGCLDEPIVVDERRFFVSASVGVTVSQPSDGPAELLQAADTAMYESKRSSERRVTFFDERLRQRSTRSLEIETELRQAIERDQLEVVYQPVVRVRDATCVGFESLLRWHHPRLGAVPPAEFIPVAEDSGVILPIGAWVLERSLQQLGRWRAELAPDLWISVNLSAQQLVLPTLVEDLHATLGHTGVPADALHLEITESVLMDRVEGSMETLESLHRLGVGLSVDDFGTGYSSLSYLKRLPIRTLKIDRSFTDGLGEDPHDSSIVQAIGALADALSLDLIAEGVETPGQRAALDRIGCELAQGFLWSKPLSADDARTWLERRRSPDPGSQTQSDRAAAPDVG